MPPTPTHLPSASGDFPHYANQRDPRRSTRRLISKHRPPSDPTNTRDKSQPDSRAIRPRCPPASSGRILTSRILPPTRGPTPDRPQTGPQRVRPGPFLTLYRVGLGVIAIATSVGRISTFNAAGPRASRAANRATARPAPSASVCRSTISEDIPRPLATLDHKADQAGGAASDPRRIGPSTRPARPQVDPRVRAGPFPHVTQGWQRRDRNRHLGRTRRSQQRRRPQRQLRHQPHDGAADRHQTSDRTSPIANQTK